MRWLRRETVLAHLDLANEIAASLDLIRQALLLLDQGAEIGSLACIFLLGSCELSLDVIEFRLLLLDVRFQRNSA